jgi:hypothetical protein
LGVGHHPEQADAGSGQLRQGGEVMHRVLSHDGVGSTCGMDDADSAAHDRYRHAQRRYRAVSPSAQFRAGVEIVAGREALYLGSARRRAAIGRIHPARGRQPGRRYGSHAQQMGVTVVGEEQLDR